MALAFAIPDLARSGLGLGSCSIGLGADIIE